MKSDFNIADTRQKKLKIARALTALIILYALQCSTLLTKKDYHYSEKYLKEWNIQGAIDALPDGESGGFITTMEKTYLNLLAGKPEIDQLITYANRIDNQIRYKASREFKTFFYIETPEGYYASEHEIIWMHILLSWGYSMRSDPEKARVEAKKSSNILGKEYSQEGRFDDPLMRIMLASMWAMSGEWEEAQVDFRAAYRLKPSLKWARKLANMKKPPKNLMIILGGTGPEPEWTPQLKVNPFRGFRGVEFNPQGVKSELVIKDAKNYNTSMEITPDSSYWYKRHFIRDNEIQDIIKDTTYTQRVAASALKGTTITIAGIATGVLVALGGIAIGGGIIVLGLYAESAEIAALGIIPIVGGPTWGYDLANKSYKYSVKETKKVMDISRTYRFVRFLPEYAWVSWSAKKLVKPVKIYRKGKPIIDSSDNQIPTVVDIVTIGFSPDTNKSFDIESPRGAFGRGR